MLKTRTTRASLRALRASVANVPDDDERLPPKTRPSRVAEIRAAAPPPDDDDERSLSKAEVITITGRSLPTIWDWMRHGKFPRARDCLVDRFG
jgi:hypothetical protein